MKLIKKTLLHYQKGTSNKVYNVYLYEALPNNYLVNFEYGRFGGNLKEGTKTKEPVSLEKAQKLYDSLVVSKMNKEYVVKEGYDSSKQEEKKERKPFTSDEYKALIVERLKKVGDLDLTEHTQRSRANGATGFRAIHASVTTTVSTTSTLKKVDNYTVSRLIYRAGELNIVEAKEEIVRIYELATDEENAFYYSVAWALGRYKDPTLRATIESLRKKLDKSSRYIVEEALFMLKDEREAEHIRALTFPMPYAVTLGAKNIEGFEQQVELLSTMITETYERYKDADDWYNDEKKKVKNELMPMLSQTDELYLKLYMWATIDEDYKQAFLSVVHLLPITELNFSLYRRIYKMAEIRGDQGVLGELITLLEAKKMACYNTYDYSKHEYKQSVGCSKSYFKKRSYRYLEDLEKYQQENYISFAKSLLLSVNHFPDSFKPFDMDYYDNNWNWKNKKYDAFATHITLMKVLYGAGKRYMLEASRKQWEIANKSIKDEHRPELYSELWDKHIDDVVEILSKSTVLEVQTFAFNVLKENPDTLENIDLETLLKMMDLKHDEARKLFFEVIKKQYNQSKDERIIKVCLFSSDENIVAFAIHEIANNLEFLLTDSIMIELVENANEKTMGKVITLVSKLKKKRVMVEEIFAKLANDTLPFDEIELNRMFILLTHSTQDIKVDDIVMLMRETELNERHLFATRLIQFKSLSHFDYPLELKEKIAQFDHPAMLATTIYLLGKLSNEELMNASDMLIAFIYHKEIAVHTNAKDIIERLGQDVESGNLLLRAIVEKSFVKASDEVAENIENVVKTLQQSYSAIEPDQLYRMLIAKSKLAVRLGGLILSNYEAKDFSVVQWARLAKNQNRVVRVWAYDAYMNNEIMVKEAMPKSLMIFDTLWEDTRTFASGYFEAFDLSSDEIVVVADSNYADVQDFAKKMIEQGDYDREVILTKLSQHPAVRIQKFVTDLMLGEMSNAQLLKMERFFNTLLHSVNQNRVAKTRVMQIFKERLNEPKIAQMVARLAGHHSATMVWADKEVFVEMMSHISEVYSDIELPLVEDEIELREVV